MDLRIGLLPVDRGLDGLASSTGDRSNQTAPLDRMADCRDEYIDPLAGYHRLLTALLHRASRQLRGPEADVRPSYLFPSITASL
jgi:hypothetical protein